MKKIKRLIKIIACYWNFRQLAIEDKIIFAALKIDPASLIKNGRL